MNDNDLVERIEHPFWQWAIGLEGYEGWLERRRRTGSILIRNSQNLGLLLPGQI